MRGKTTKQTLKNDMQTRKKKKENMSEKAKKEIMRYVHRYANR